MVRLETLRWNQNEFYMRCRNDPKIRKWCRQTGLIDENKQSEWFKWQSADSSVQMFEVVKGDQVVGVCGLTSIDLVNRRAEFSLWIDPVDQRQKSGTEAIKLLFDFGFKDLGLNVIWGECFDGNPALEMFKNLGMKNEGKRQEFYFKDGKFIDAHLVSVKASEWNG